MARWRAQLPLAKKNVLRERDARAHRDTRADVEKGERLREYYRQRYIRDRTKIRARQHEYYLRNRKKLIRQFTAYKKERERKLWAKLLRHFDYRCAWCGETDTVVLELDHLNGGGTRQRKLLNRPAMLIFALEHLDRFQILCRNCNWRKYRGKATPLHS